MAKRKVSPQPNITPVPINVVVECRRTEEALHKSEERFRLLVETMNDGFGIQDRDGLITYVNNKFGEMLGFSREEMIGRRVVDFLDDASRQVYQEEMVGRRRGGSSSYELVFRAKDGRKVLVIASARPLPDGADGFAGSFAVLTDITESKRAEGALRRGHEELEQRVEERTAELRKANNRLRREIEERKRAEEALRESEAKWRSLVENAPDIISTVDRDGIIQFINRTLPGISVEEAIGSSVYDYAPPDQHSTMREAYERVFQTGETVSYESTGLGPDGAMAWYSVRVSPVKSGGKVVALTVIATDITERKRAEEALRESEERLRTVISSAPIVIWALDPDGVFTLSDGKGLEALGLKPGEVVGRSVFDVYRDVPEIVENNRRALAGEDFTTTLDIEGFGSTWEARYSPYRDQNGAVAGVIGVAIDISERKRMEEALQRAREELEGKVEHQMLRRNPYGLTFREFTVLHHVAAGRADKEIARELGISPLTVHKHVSNILAKMNAASRTEAGVRALREGLLE